MWIIWLLCSLAFYTVAEYVSKLFSNAPGICWKWIWWAWGAYSINVFFWLASLKSKNELAILSTIYSLAYIISSVFLGYVMFGELITTRQWIGIVLSIIAVSIMM
jgi:drug/metabolite transporter (DMT)-like permease